MVRRLQCVANMSDRAASGGRGANGAGGADGAHGDGANRDLGGKGDGNGRGIECSIRVGGVDFVLVPAAGDLGSAQMLSAPSRASRSTMRRLWEARRAAGLTQAQLAKRLARSQAMVSQAESGHSQVSERYVRKVLEACGLQAEWGLPEGYDTGPEIDPRDVAGLDPGAGTAGERAGSRVGAQVCLVGRVSRRNLTRFSALGGHWGRWLSRTCSGV